EEIRKRTMLALIASGWILTLVLAAMSIGISKFAFPATVIAASSNLIPTWMVLQGRTDRAARWWCGILVGFLPTLLFYTVQGTSWQNELLLLLASGLVALVPLCDHRPLIIASTLLILQHMIFAIYAPHWIAYEGMNFGLSSLRIGGTLFGGIVLSWIALLLRQKMGQTEELSEALDKSQAELHEASATIDRMREMLRTEKEEQLKHHDKIITKHKAECEEISAALAESINTATNAVTNTVKTLERSAHQLKVNADQAGEDANKVVSSAETASRVANTVAAGVAELSVAIAEVAENAGQQTELSNEASEVSGGGGEAVQTLTEQSETISEATRSIVRIAERTNLLSFNAAIEAASAGSAGRGFSIVANEVKQLAAQASEAAIRIQAFLAGVHTGTIEAERSFREIDTAIGELGQNARAIRHNVENHRQSADTIESFARNAASDADLLVKRSRTLSDRAAQTKRLSGELDQAAKDLTHQLRTLKSANRQLRPGMNVG
ncbi:MAG: methyl-accepting chemotaxis protein, partial [Pseudomonadota bacterium]